MKRFILLIILLSIATLVTSQTNKNVWEELADSSSSPKGKNASIYYSIIKTHTYFHISKLLSSTDDNFTLFVPINCSFPIDRYKQLFQCSSCQEEMKNKQKPCISLKFSNPNDNLMNFLHYQIAMGQFNPHNLTNPIVLPTHLDDPKVVNLSPPNQQVIIIQNDQSTNTAFVIDGVWPPAKIYQFLPASNGGIALVNRPLIIPQSLNIALGLNKLYGFRRLLIHDRFLQIANSTSGITIFALNNLSKSDLAANYLVNGTHYVFGGGTTLLKSWNGNSLKIVVCSNNQITANDSFIVKATVLIKNGIIFILKETKPEFICNSNNNTTSNNNNFTTQQQPYLTEWDWWHNPKRNWWWWTVDIAQL